MAEQRIDDLVLQHDKDLYRGNGKPGLTTRMQQAEDCQVVHGKRIDGMDAKFWAIVLLILTLLGGVITDIVMKATTNGHASLITTDSFTASK